MPVYITYRVCFLCGNPLEMLITITLPTILLAVAIMLILNYLFLGVLFFAIHSIGLLLPFRLILGHRWLLYLLDRGDEMSPALCNMDDIPFMVDNLGEILVDSTFALLCGALNAWLELILLGGDHPAAYVSFLDKIRISALCGYGGCHCEMVNLLGGKTTLLLLLLLQNSLALQLSLLWPR
jgi:hypothetical protein